MEKSNHFGILLLFHAQSFDKIASARNSHIGARDVISSPRHVTLLSRATASSPRRCGQSFEPYFSSHFSATKLFLLLIRWDMINLSPTNAPQASENHRRTSSWSL